MPHLMPRFSGPGCASPQEMLRWEEYAMVGRLREKLAAFQAELLRSYPRLDTPDAIERAYDALQEADDLLGRRQSALDDSSFGEE